MSTEAGPVHFREACQRSVLIHIRHRQRDLQDDRRIEVVLDRLMRQAGFQHALLELLKYFRQITTLMGNRAVGIIARRSQSPDGTRALTPPGKRKGDLAIMVEKAYRLSQVKQKTVEKIIMDDNIHYIHMIFGNGEGLPLHHANAPVYMTVVRGTLTVKLDEQETHRHENGTLLVIPAGTLMDVGNRDEELLELIVVKAPAPKG